MQLKVVCQRVRVAPKRNVTEYPPPTPRRNSLLELGLLCIETGLERQ